MLLLTLSCMPHSTEEFVEPLFRHWSWFAAHLGPISIEKEAVILITHSVGV